jgi:hypothetical protein
MTIHTPQGFIEHAARQAELAAATAVYSADTIRSALDMFGDTLDERDRECLQRANYNLQVASNILSKIILPKE